jgi:membrane-bound lytic murein transglycosylase A
VPYYTRAEIDFAQQLAGRNLELVWVDNLVDLFFLQVQGSGMIKLDDGSLLRVGYADKNGHRYRAIANLLVQEQVIPADQVSMQRIRAYLAQHPERVEQVLSYNPSYVFFSEQQGNAVGSLGVPLTPYRSIATDSRLFPKAALTLIQTEKPELDAQNQIQRWVPFRRFVLNQDTGGAIRGPQRVDLFTGAGVVSEVIAGHMKQRGTFYFLLKKEGTTCP